MQFDFWQGNYDFLHGTLVFGSYFLSRFEHKGNGSLKNKYQAYLSEFIDALVKQTVSDKMALKSELILDTEKGNNGFNLSLSYGISITFNLATRLHRYDVLKKIQEKILKLRIIFLVLKRKFMKTHFMFHSCIEKDIPPEYNDRIVWYNGDFDIGICILRIGKSLEDKSMRNHALEILSYNAIRKSLSRTLVNNIVVCSGSYRNAIIYRGLHEETEGEQHMNSLMFWMGNGIQKANFDNSYANRKQGNGIKKIAAGTIIT